MISFNLEYQKILHLGNKTKSHFLRRISCNYHKTRHIHTILFGTSHVSKKKKFVNVTQFLSISHRKVL